MLHIYIYIYTSMYSVLILSLLVSQLTLKAFFTGWRRFL